LGFTPADVIVTTFVATGGGDGSWGFWPVQAASAPAMKRPQYRRSRRVICFIVRPLAASASSLWTGDRGRR